MFHGWFLTISVVADGGRCVLEYAIGTILLLGEYCLLTILLSILLF